MASKKKKKTASKKKRATAKKAAPEAKAQGRNGGISAFIRSLPADMPAAEVVAKGAEQGIAIRSTSFVHTVRSKAKKDAAGGRTGQKGQKGQKGRKVYPRIKGDDEIGNIVAQFVADLSRVVIGKVEESFRANI